VGPVRQSLTARPAAEPQEMAGPRLVPLLIPPTPSAYITSSLTYTARCDKKWAGNFCYSVYSKAQPPALL
jgi:hypothetical protein